MASNLQRRPRTPAALGLYRFGGDLSALAGGPGRRVVRDLELRGPEGSLDVLRAFPDLRHLSIRDAGPLALDPLADLSLTQLSLSNCRGFDIAPLARLDRLETLWLVGLEAARV